MDNPVIKCDMPVVGCDRAVGVAWGW